MNKMLLALLLATPFNIFAAEWSGIVVGITDGDTLTVLNSHKESVKIRLTEIDAPESKQAFGTQSKQSLSDICFKKSVVVDDKGTDKYKRTLGRLKCDGVDANAEQVKRGMAWAYTQYLTDKTIADFQQKAKDSSLGLWANSDPIEPWDFRKGKTKPISIDDSFIVYTDGANSKGYITGPRGGCYKLTATGNKRYVDHSFCKE
jgi:endonuclease YncB( thermonuclease family)